MLTTTTTTSSQRCTSPSPPSLSCSSSSSSWSLVPVYAHAHRIAARTSSRYVPSCISQPRRTHRSPSQARSLPENSLLRKQTSTSASWSWVGTECTIYPPEWVDPTFECESNVMYCTNTLQVCSLKWRSAVESRADFDSAGIVWRDSC